MAHWKTQALTGLEIAAWLTGLLLLSIWAGARLQAAQARADGLARFEAARSQSVSADISGTDGAAFHGIMRPEPDQSLWSSKRVAAYRASLESDIDVPEGILRIPSVQLAVPVYAGTAAEVLDRGAGRIEGTADPDSTGNVGIAAHRDGFFRVLKDVELGEEVQLETHRTLHRYRIEELLIVQPEDVHVLAETEQPTLTLVTCYPFYHVGRAPQRFIVRARRVGDETT